MILLSLVDKMTSEGEEDKENNEGEMSGNMEGGEFGNMEGENAVPENSISS